MKRIIKYILIVNIILAVSWIWKYSSNSDKKQGKNTSFKVPHRLIANGPYGKNIRSTEQIGSCTLDMEAKKLYFRKSKIMGFDNGLLKKLVAEELYITISNDDKRLLSIFKKRVDMRADMKNIIIKDPDILYPETIKQPDKVVIDKNKQLIALYYGHTMEVLNLE